MRTHIDAAAEKLRSSKHSFYRFVNPVTIGTVTAASIYPVTLNAARQFKFAVPLADRWLAVSQTFGSVPARVYFIVVGFSMGYGLSKGIGWLRTKLLEVLFRYQGWTNGHSVTTKVWSILVKLIRGPRPFSTHEFESVLPRQPLPDLDSTLDKWLGVARQLVNKDEFELTEEVVEEFRHKEGPRLQAYLRVRATKNINWLSDYWLAAAYLSSRDPIAVKSNYYQCSRMNHVTDQVTRGAGQLRQLIQFYELLSHDSFPSTLMQGLVPLCMNGFKYVFNCVRLPGEHMDSPAIFPGHAYIVVIRKGHYFKLDIYANQTTGQKSLLTTTELKNQLQKICQLADELEEELSVAALTSQNRAVWAKQREVLAEKNEVTLRTVEACAFVFSLDTDNPKDCNECCKMAMTGNGSNRWFDKCFTSIVYPEGTAAVNVEHSVIDATVFGAVAEYCVGGERYENGDIIPDPPSSPRTVSTPVRLHWDLSDVKEMISMAMQDFRQL
ncbi:Carnitine O-acetyltransferase, mitochondrial, partial [Lamellibrachia satsuma]